MEEGAARIEGGNGRRARLSSVAGKGSGPSLSLPDEGGTRFPPSSALHPVRSLPRAFLPVNGSRIRLRRRRRVSGPFSAIPQLRRDLPPT